MGPFFPTLPRTLRTVLAVTAGAASFGAFAQSGPPAPPHRLGEHPAVLVQRQQARAGCDYAAKFYPHPAWLYLRATPPADAGEPAAPPTLAQAPAPTAPR